MSAAVGLPIRDSRRIPLCTPEELFWGLRCPTSPESRPAETSSPNSPTTNTSVYTRHSTAARPTKRAPATVKPTPRGINPGVRSRGGTWPRGTSPVGAADPLLTTRPPWPAAPALPGRTGPNTPPSHGLSALVLGSAGSGLGCSSPDRPVQVCSGGSVTARTKALRKNGRSSH